MISNTQTGEAKSSAKLERHTRKREIRHLYQYSSTGLNRYLIVTFEGKTCVNLEGSARTEKNIRIEYHNTWHFVFPGLHIYGLKMPINLEALMKMGWTNGILVESF